MNKRAAFFSAAIVTITVCAINKSSAADLRDRYKTLSCSVVHIQNAGVSGTGFFIDDHGTVLTAAHVLLAPIKDPTTPNKVNFAPYLSDVVTTSDDAHFTASLPMPTPAALASLEHDLMLLPTNIPNPCHLTIGDSKVLQPGQSVVGMGFPQGAVHAIIYTGIISGRLAYLQPNTPFDYFRVQMPISPGASGGPLLNDDDLVIGIIDAEPFGFPDDVNTLANIYGSGQGKSGGLLVNGIDLSKVIGEIAFSITAGVSPGSGYGMPIEYLHQ